MSCNRRSIGIGKRASGGKSDALWAARMAPPRGRHPVPFLNSSKGAAVRATARRPTACSTGARYGGAWKTSPIVTLFQQPVDDLLVEGVCVRGVETRRPVFTFEADAVVLTTGTFLSACLRRPPSSTYERPGGRGIRRPSDFRGTPASWRCRRAPYHRNAAAPGRPHRSTSRCWPSSRATIRVRSFLRHGRCTRQRPWVTHTNARDWPDVIRAGLDRSPMYSG